MGRTKPTEREREAALLAELETVYRDAAETFAGWTCPASTECCRFGVTGREPYVTSIELAAVSRAVAVRGGPRALQRAPKPLALGADGQPTPRSPGARRVLPRVAERPCPMLTSAGRCAIYAARPLGCRTFFCDRATSGAAVRHREVVALVRRVQDISVRHAPGGDQGRPLTSALSELPGWDEPSGAGAKGHKRSRR